MSRLFLGLDASTQSLSAVVIDHDARQVVYETSIGFDEALPHYGTRNGVLSDPDPKVVHTPPQMRAEALDVLFETMGREGVPLGEILAVSGSGQQHGSVYLCRGADAVLAGLNPSRERVGEAFGLDWEGFSAALRSTLPGNEGKIMRPYFEPEIVPNVLESGVRRFDLEEDDAARNCRAVVEAQMMSMRLHSEWIDVRPVAIYATGGASANREILPVMADVHGCPVQRFEVTNSAASGAARRAAHGYFLERGEERGWEEIVAGLGEPIVGSEIEPAAHEVYDELVQKYAECERQVLGRRD